MSVVLYYCATSGPTVNICTFFIFTAQWIQVTNGPCDPLKIFLSIVAVINKLPPTCLRNYCKVNKQAFIIANIEVTFSLFKVPSSA